MNWDLLDWTIIGPALGAGLLVLSTHVPFGQEVLRRGIIFIDLAIAQVAGLGVIMADAMSWEHGGIEVQIAAVLAALTAALALHWTESKWPKTQEPLIGSVFILAATGGILLLAGNPHGSEHIRDLLVGQILWSTWESLLPIVIVYVAVLAFWRFAHRRLGGIGFYASFAIVVTVSVQVVGIYLVFASLIIPALATHRLPAQQRLISAYAIGGISYLLGIMLSSLLDLPTGAVIVWTMAGVALAGNLILTRRVPTGDENTSRT
ncbi:MAG: metal ABC transporter permease [Gammaproteobacteria bacterium]|jgi:zinc/manganese transport system permease protein